jgi:23S rRNA pseudouridine1911/1915/1917 synthase
VDHKQTTRIEITADDADKRLDVVLAQRLKLSRTQVRRLLEKQLILLNAAAVGPRSGGTKLAADDSLEVLPFARPENQQAVGRMDLPWCEIARGDDWVMINKPAAMAVHPLDADQCDTALNALSARWPQVHGVGEGGLRSGVVHRLDVGTSGTLLFALEQSRWQQFRTAFARHQTRKIYHALVTGTLTGQAEASHDLTVSQHRPARVRVVTDQRRAHDANVRRCTLRWRALETFADASLIEIELGTGFLHQIRVMMAHLGHPLLGDATYGAAEVEELPANRPLLHAQELKVAVAYGHCTPPDDFQQTLAQLRS